MRGVKLGVAIALLPCSSIAQEMLEVQEAHIEQNAEHKKPHLILLMTANIDLMP